MKLFPRQHLRGTATGRKARRWMIDRVLVIGVLLWSDSARTESFASFSLDPQNFGKAFYGVTRDAVGNLWFTRGVVDEIWRVSPTGDVTRFPIPAPAGEQTDVTSSFQNITAGPDGNIWFADKRRARIGRLRKDGSVSGFPLPTPSYAPLSVCAGPDGKVWYTASIPAINSFSPGRIGSVSSTGEIQEFLLPAETGNFGLFGQLGTIIAGPDGNLWFTNQGRSGRISPAGSVTLFNYSPLGGGITVGPDRNLWIAGNKSLFRVTSTGATTEYAVPRSGTFPQLLGGIAAGVDGGIWFTGQDSDQSCWIGRSSTSGLLSFVPLNYGAVPPGAGCSPWSIAAGSDGRMWFTDAYPDQNGRPLWSMTVDGHVTPFALPHTGSVSELAVGQDGALWYPVIQRDPTSEGDRIDRLQTNGVLTQRAVQLGSTRPRGLVAAPSGELFFLETLPNTLDVFSSSAGMRRFPLAFLGAAAFLGADERLWIVGADRVASVDPSDPSQPPVEFRLTSGSPVGGATTGPDGAIWFTDSDGNSVGRMSQDGSVSRFALPGGGPTNIIAGPDGNLWFAEAQANRIGRITASGSISEFDIPSEMSLVAGLAGALDGNVWFTGRIGNKVGRINAAGQITLLDIPSSSSGSAGIATGQDGNIWFSEDGVSENLWKVVLDPAATFRVPVVIDANGAHDSHFTSDLVLVNRGDSPARALLTFTARPGTQGSGGPTVEEIISPGTELRVSDVMAFLRGLGYPIPGSDVGAIGSLFVSFPDVAEVGTVFVGSRISTPNPNKDVGGSFGLFETGVRLVDASNDTVTIIGLREDEASRSNLALVGVPMDQGPTVVSVQVIDGDTGQAAGSATQVVLPTGSWVQLNSVLKASGVKNGYATVKRLGSAANRFIGYGVMNDAQTSDGSLLPPSASPGLVPVVLRVHSGSVLYTSELVLTNTAATDAIATLIYTPSSQLGPASAVTTTLLVAAGRQIVIPDVVRWLRSPSGGSSGVATDEGGTLLVDGVSALVRTTNPNPDISVGGSFGVAYPAYASTARAHSVAWIYGLRQDEETRSNLAIADARIGDSSTVNYLVDVFDSINGRASPTKTLGPFALSGGQWFQVSSILGRAGFSRGYARVRTQEGTSDFVAYGVVNDGASPGQGTSDGSFVPMSVEN